MEKRIFKLYSVFVSLFLAVLLSCSDNTVPSPEMEKIEGSESGSRAVLSAPQNVTVSQGGKREINIMWDEVSKASRYYIYASDSLFSEYELVGESTKNSFTYSPLVAGITKYLRICSVDYAGNLSSKTEPLVGTTLAQPIISDITTVSGKEDSALVVYWYMENADFYKDELEYTIICKNSEGKEVANSNVYASELESASFSLDDLKPSENYTYSVTAFLSSNPTASEVSLEVDAETARRLRPNPPEELAATEGTEKDTITVSFKLPEKVDVLVAAKTYVQYPLYFKIYRRLSGTEDWGNAIVNHLYFTGDTEKPSDLDFTTYDEKRTTDGYKVTWTDTTVTRGIKYEYKVQSYADDTTRIITSDLSSGETTGWAAAIPKFEAKSTFTANDEGSAYASVTISFDFDWETFGNESGWKFILKTLNSASFDDIDSATATYELLESLEPAKSFSRDYDLTDTTKEGYYKYALIIAKADDVTEDLSGIDEKIFIEIPAATTFFLTSVMNQPNLATFSVKDGFVSKNEVSWSYEDGTSYVLERKTLNSDGTVVADSKVEITDFADDDGNAPTQGAYTYSDDSSVESGKIYSYTLYATITIENLGDKKFPSSALTAKTLGTPEPQFDENAVAYNSISVSWAEVQQAESYEVALFDDETQLGETETLDADKIPGILTAGVLTYKISDPVGYDDATISGKDLTLKVTAKGAVDSSEKEVVVRTMGPAALELTASKATSSDKITVEWNKVTGAAGYILQRVRYNIPENGENEAAQKTDVFYVGASGEIMFGETEISDTNIMMVETKNEKVTFLDKQIEKLSTNVGFETSQSMISCGLPFEYTIIPVLDTDDASGASTIEEFKIPYKNLNALAKRGSTKGFGHNIKASKADYSNKITVTWHMPYGAEELQPVVYKKLKDSGEWSKTEPLAARTESWEEEISDSDIHEYAVNYGEKAFSNSYSTILASAKTTLDEQENQGYAFILPNSSLTPISNSDAYSESVHWTPYNTDARKVGPKNYTLYCKNTNYPSGWQKIATLDENGKISSTIDTGTYDYNVTYAYSDDSYSLVLTAKTATAYGEITGGGSYNGLLKVLRDPRHYYKLAMSRENSDGDEISYTIGESMDKYAYRQITDAELARAAMGELAYAFYINDGGATSYYDTNQHKYGGEGTLTTENGGTAKFEDRDRATGELGTGKFKQYFNLKSYAPSQLTPSGDSKTFLALSMDESSWGIKGDSDNYIYTFQGRKTGTETYMLFSTKDVYDKNGIITVAKGADDLPDTYQATIRFTCADKNTLYLYVTRNGGSEVSICETTDTDVRRYYFPMQIHSAAQYELGSTYYGWWEE